MKKPHVLLFLVVIMVFDSACNKKDTVAPTTTTSAPTKATNPIVQIKTSNVDTVTGTLNFYLDYPLVNNDSICSYSFYINNVTADSFIIIGCRKIIEPCVADTLSITFGVAKNDSGIYYDNSSGVTARIVKDSMYVNWSNGVNLYCICDQGVSVGHFAGKLKSTR